MQPNHFFLAINSADKNNIAIQSQTAGWIAPNPLKTASKE